MIVLLCDWLVDDFSRTIFWFVAIPLTCIFNLASVCLPLGSGKSDTCLMRTLVGGFIFIIAFKQTLQSSHVKATLTASSKHVFKVVGFGHTSKHIHIFQGHTHTL